MFWCSNVKNYNADDNEPKSFNNDISRRRLVILKAIIKQKLLSKETNNATNLLKEVL